MPARGHIRQRPSGQWYVILPVRQRDGSNKQRWFRAGPTKESAERLRARLIHELAEGTYLDASATPLADFLEEWLTHLAAKGRRERTIRIYRDAIAQHLAPALGKTSLSRLTARAIEAFYTHALTGGRMDGKGGLSATTVRLHHSILRGALRQAVRWGMIARSPLDAVEPPAPGPRKGRALGAADLARLIEAAAGTWLELPVLLAAFGGLRRGEVVALRWDDVDLAAGVVAIRAAKTAAGIRTVALPAFVLERLRRERPNLARDLPLGARLGEVAGSVFPRSASALTEGFRRFAEREGFGRLRFHDLRHSAATTLLLGGHSVKAVSGRLGHASSATTMEIYGHYLTEHDEALAAWLQERFG